MAKTNTRLTGRQRHQFNVALGARFKELCEAKVSQAEAARMLGEGLGFAVPISAFRDGLEALELAWPTRRERSGGPHSNRDVLDVLVRDMVRLTIRLGEEPSPLLVRYHQARTRRAARDTASATPAQALLPMTAPG